MDNVEDRGRNKRKIVVEGDADRDAFFQVFKKKFETTWKKFTDTYYLTEVGGKKKVLQSLKKHSDWIGLVDRDTWDDGKVAGAKEGRPYLIVLERYCIENYIIIPDELWEAIPGELQTRIKGGLDEFKRELLKDLNKWIRHGVLWHIVEPLFSGLREEGFHNELLENVEKTVTDDEIRKTLTRWHDVLSPDGILNRFNKTLKEVTALSNEEKLKRWIVGKGFFNNVVYPYFCETFGQRSIKEYRKIIWENRPISNDFDFMWNSFDL